MAWDSGIAYNASLADAVRETLETWTVHDLAVAIANDRYERMFPFTLRADTLERRHRAFERWIRNLETLPHDVLVDECMDCAEKTNTADNGGFAIWIDKSGCSKVKLQSDRGL